MCGVHLSSFPDGLSAEFGGSSATKADRVYTPESKELLGYFMGFSLATVGQFEISPHVMFNPYMGSARGGGREGCGGGGATACMMLM